jgi:peptide/nickel transport system permease protein
VGVVTNGDPNLQLSGLSNPEAPMATNGSWRAILASFAEHRLAVVGFGIIVFIVLFSFLGPVVYHTNQVYVDLSDVAQPPSWRHLLGTDDKGYDVLGRLMLGGQSSLEVGVAAAILASILGTAWGAVAGYVGGAVDALMMRVVDSFLAIPYLLFVLLLTSIFPPTIPVLIVAIGSVAWLAAARLVRGETLTLRTRDYVQAAKVAGNREWRIIVRHIVPNCIGIIVVQTTFEVANAILLLSVLSYLGLGPPPPAVNWGGMLSEGLTYIYDGYWWLIYPVGVAIVLVVMSFNFLGDALRDAFEVRLQRR